MELITLNIWGGSVHEPLLAFIQAYQKVDIFCLQEVYRQAPGKISTDNRGCALNIFDEIGACLPEHQGFFRPIVQGNYGLATFIKKDIVVQEEGDVLIHPEPDYLGYGPAHPRNMQWLKCKKNEKIFILFNVHGLWNGRGKTDTPERLAQSQRIREAMNAHPTELKLLAGDFNLRPDTESLALVGQELDNLIQRYGVQSTRTALYHKTERFADYIFTSKAVTVEDFKVLPDEVSDHAALWMKIHL